MSTGSGVAVAATPWLRARGSVSWFLSQSYAGAMIAVVILCLVMSQASKYFLTYENLSLVTRSFSFVAIAAIGQLLVVITRGIDVSVGSTMGLAGVVMALLAADGAPPAVAVAAGLASGIVVGTINGLLISYGRLVPFMVTLGTLYVVRGLIIVITNAAPVFGLAKFPAIKEFGQGFILGLPIPIWLMAGSALIWGFVLFATPFGRHIYAIGGSQKAATLAGIRVRATVLAAYVISGFMAALAGVLLTSRLGIGDPTSGTGYELNIIASVVIGGASFSGGTGTVFGVLWGAALLGLVVNAMTLAGVSAYWGQVVIGAVVIAAVVIDRVRTPKEAR